MAELEEARPFHGFGPPALAFFEGLEKDNSKAYFQANRAEWQAHVRDQLAALLGELAEEFGGTVKLFRPHRDVRFSPDKSPYKTNGYGILHSRPGTDAALYAEVSADGLYAATGYYAMARDQLMRFRAAVVAESSGPALVETVADLRTAGLRFADPVLKTAPRGFPRDHPRVALLRHKDLIAGLDLEPGEELASRRALEHVGWVWRTAAPLNAWLDEHVGRSEARGPRG